MPRRRSRVAHDDLPVETNRPLPACDHPGPLRPARHEPLPRRGHRAHLRGRTVMTHLSVLCWRLTACQFRLMRTALDVLEVCCSLPAIRPSMGLEDSEGTGLGSGTVYPILDRLTTAGTGGSPLASLLPPSAKGTSGLQVDVPAGDTAHGACTTRSSVSCARLLVAVGEDDEPPPPPGTSPTPRC